MIAALVRRWEGSGARASTGLPVPADRLRLAEWAFLAGVAALWTGWLSVSPGMLQGIDYLRYYSLNAEWIRQGYLEGRIPWWNPYVGLGRPFFADLQTGFFYPPHALHAALGVRTGTLVLVWLHFTWARYGMNRLAAGLGCTRWIAWLVALAFMLSPPLGARALEGQIHYLTALCYIPGILWLQVLILQQPTGRRSVFLALVTALQLL